MAIETQPERAEPTGRGPEVIARRPWWLSPGVHTGLIGAVIGYFLGHWLGNFLGGDYARSSLSDANDVAIVLGYALRRDRLGGRPGRVQRPVRPHARPAAARGAPADRQGGPRPGQVLPVHARSQGGRHPVPVRHDRLLPDRRPVRHGHPERAALAVVPPHRPRAVPDGGRRARHDDDDDDVLGHPRSVRPVLRAAADRVQAGRVPPARGARLLAHPGRLRHPAVRRAVRRVPHRLDRVRAAGSPGHVGGGRLLLRVRPDGHLDDPGRLQHDRHDHQLPGPRHALEQAPDVRLVHVHRVVPAGAGGPGAGRGVLHGPRSTGPSRPRSSPTSSAAAASCTRTCSGSSAIRRCTSWPCPASASSPRWSRCSAANRCSATRSRRRACSASASCPSSSGSITCSTAGSTRTCGRCSCSPPS